LAPINSGSKKNGPGSVNNPAVLAGGGSVVNQKYVKPSELSLDLIMPSSIRGATKPPQPYHGNQHLYARQANNSSVNDGS